MRRRGGRLWPSLGCGSGEEPASVGGRGGARRVTAERRRRWNGWQIADGPTDYDSDRSFTSTSTAAHLSTSISVSNGWFTSATSLATAPSRASLSTSTTWDLISEPSDSSEAAARREAEARDWGAEGYRSGTVAAAWKGSVSIHAEADEDQPELIEAMESLVAQVAKSVVPAAPRSRRSSILLPREGLVPLSERIVAKDLMSHAFLPGGVLATYRGGGRRRDPVLQ